MKVTGTTGIPPCQPGMPMGIALTPPLGTAAISAAVPEAAMPTAPTEGNVLPISIAGLSRDEVLDMIRDALGVEEPANPTAAELFYALPPEEELAPSVSISDPDTEQATLRFLHALDMIFNPPPPLDREGVPLTIDEEHHIAQLFARRVCVGAEAFVWVAACMNMTPTFILNAFKETLPGSPLWYQRIHMNLVKVEATLPRVEGELSGYYYGLDRN